MKKPRQFLSHRTILGAGFVRKVDDTAVFSLFITALSTTRPDIILYSANANNKVSEEIVGILVCYHLSFDTTFQRRLESDPTLKISLGVCHTEATSYHQPTLT